MPTPTLSSTGALKVLYQPFTIYLGAPEIISFRVPLSLYESAGSVSFILKVFNTTHNLVEIAVPQAEGPEGPEGCGPRERYKTVNVLVDTEMLGIFTAGNYHYGLYVVSTNPAVHIAVYEGDIIVKNGLLG